MSIELQNVNFTYPGTDVGVTGIDLTVADGELLAVIGASGSGKTTLLKLIAGFETTNAGHILLNGEDVSRLPVRDRQLGVVFQSYALFPHMTAWQNVAYPLKIRRTAPAERHRLAVEALARVGLKGFEDRRPQSLSGGQQQRIALARALAKEAHLLLLDEPLVNLDYKLREELRQELRYIFEVRESCVVYATTEPLEALMLGGNTMVMDQGRVLQAGPTLEVFNNPASERVGSVFSDPPINLLGGRVENGAALLGGDVRMNPAPHMAGLADGEYRFGVRANNLFMARRNADDAEIEGVVELAEISGSETFVHVGHHGISWVAQEDGVQRFGLNQPVRLYVNPRSLFVFDMSGALAAAPARAAVHEKTVNGGETAHG